MEILRIISYFIVFASTVLVILAQEPNNVCNTIEAYFSDMQTNPNCWHDFDVGVSPERVAKNHGIALDKHMVRTDDGYVLQMFRLRNSRGEYGKIPVYLQHGLGADGACFLFNGNKSIALFLVQQGFDVWLGNFRGNSFTSHETLSRNDPNFWDFSFHEHGLYDIKANAKYIYEKTKQKVTYVGHSMGGTAMAIYASMKPKESQQYISHAILVAGTYYMRNTQGLVNPSLIENVYQLLPLIQSANYNFFGDKNSFEMRMIKRQCLSNADMASLCLDFVKMAVGPDYIQVPAEVLPGALEIINMSGMKTTHHYAQLIQSGEFRMFDYGPAENRRRYRSVVPPNYNLDRIEIPITLIYGEFDTLGTKVDTNWIYERFHKDNWDIYEIPNYNHLAFFYDSNVGKNFYPVLLKAVTKYLN